jgi:hypothetical protein
MCAKVRGAPKGGSGAAREGPVRLVNTAMGERPSSASSTGSLRSDGGRASGGRARNGTSTGSSASGSSSGSGSSSESGGSDRSGSSEGRDSGGGSRSGSWRSLSRLGPKLKAGVVFFGGKEDGERVKLARRLDEPGEREHGCPAAEAQGGGCTPAPPR